MKKLTSIFLALLLSLSIFTACDDDSDSSDNKKSKKESSTVTEFNQTVTTDDWEFVLKDVTYGTNLGNYTKQDDYLYELPEGDERRDSKDKAYKADEGEGYVVLVYNLKNISGNSLDYAGNTAIKYDGEVYKSHPYSNSNFNLRIDDAFKGFQSYTFEPSSEYEVRVCFDVPYEILENKHKPLDLIVTFDKEYTFRIR